MSLKWSTNHVLIFVFMQLTMGAILGTYIDAGYCVPTCDIQSITEGAKVPDPTNCSRYYICSDGDEDGHFELSDNTLNCAGGMYFEISTHECEMVPTNGSSYCTNICNPCQVECTAPGTQMPDPYSCSDYFICLVDLTYARVACPDGTVYDYEQQQCFSGGKCYELCDPCEVYCAEEGRVPDPDDCRSYYYCQPPNDSAHFECETNEIFDVMTNICVNGTDCSNSCFQPTTTAAPPSTTPAPPPTTTPPPPPPTTTPLPPPPTTTPRSATTTNNNTISTTKNSNITSHGSETTAFQLISRFPNGLNLSLFQVNEKIFG